VLGKIWPQLNALRDAFETPVPCIWMLNSWLIDTTISHKQKIKVDHEPLKLNELAYLVAVGLWDFQAFKM